MEHFICWLRDPSKVLNGQHKYVIVDSELVLVINIIANALEHLERKTLRLLQIIPADKKIRSKVKFALKFFYHRD